MKRQKSWDKSPISQISKIILGGTPKRSCSDYWKGRIYWATPSDINLKKTRYLDHTKEKITEKGLDKSNTKLLPKDSIIITARGTVGELCMLSKPMAFNQSCYGLVCNEKINNFFLFYSIKASIDQVKSQTYGAVFDTITIKSFDNIFIPVPPLPTQHKIASILSAYDDLIENNLRRIKILEEMAQLIYREWFVHYRFPGHEKVKMVDSPLGKIPEGWIITSLGEHLIGLESGKRPRGGAGGIKEGIPSIGAENIIGVGKHNYENEKFVPDLFFNEMKKGIVKDKDIALYKDGANIGRTTYFRNSFPYRTFCVNEHVFLLRSNGSSLTQNYLYLWLQESQTVSTIRSTNSNAAQPGINQKGVKGVKLILPHCDVINKFDSFIDTFFLHIVKLAKTNRILQQTRDLLLPKLISGEIDVSDLDINTRRVEE